MQNLVKTIFSKYFILFVSFGFLFTLQSNAQETTGMQNKKLLQSYLDIKDALVKGNVQNASTGATQFLDALKTADPQKEDKLGESLSQSATAIVNATDLASQREKFNSFSNDFIKLAGKQKLSNEPLYKQYCPMKKAYWLSASKNIENPYYGSAMLTCGVVKETL
ncbi:MAG: DUF3347 domain-containing protein [Ferruginibacter sp.]